MGAILPATSFAPLAATALLGWPLTAAAHAALALLLGVASFHALLLVADARRHHRRLTATAKPSERVARERVAQLAVRHALRRRLPVLTLLAAATLVGQLPILLRFGEGAPAASLALTLATGALGTLLGTLLLAPAILVRLLGSPPPT